MRPVVLLLLAALLFAGCTGKNNDPEEGANDTIAPPPHVPPPPPTPGSVIAHVNDTWRYQGDGNETVVSTVTALNDTVVRLRTTSQRVNATPHVTTTFGDARTLAILAIEDSAIGATLRFEPALPILIPAVDHDYHGTLSADTPFGVVTQPVTAHIRYFGLENVTTPAGTFETYHYNATIESNGLFPFKQNSDIWFSPAVAQAVKTIRDGRTQELVSYSTAS